MPTYPPPVVPPTSANEGHTLHRLFGQELDAYIDAHGDTYEQAKKKWAECSMDEWRNGAEGNLFRSHNRD